MNQYNRLHSYHIAVTLCLITTGLILNSSFSRDALSTLRIFLRYTHIFAGSFFIVTLVIYCSVLVRNWDNLKGQDIRKIMNLLSIFVAAGVSLTGILLVLGVDISNLTGFSSINWHREIVALGSLAVVYHSIFRLMIFIWKPFEDAKLDSVEKGFKMGRRSFIGSVSAAVALLSGGAVAKWLWQNEDLTISSRTAKKYRNCNKIDPQPIPNLGSVPPIGGGYSGEFEVFTVTKIPCINSEEWRFRVFGLVEKSITFSWKEFLDVPRKVQVSNFYCITGWSVLHITYEGIQLAALLDLAGVKTQAEFVKFYSGDGIYTSALGIKQARMEDVMVAMLMDGEPIPSDLGGPVRLIVPQMYAYKGVKWVNAIELINEPHVGYWESRGYENDAWVQGK
ncbi:MAG: oxidoreductase [Firmicutes bacterium]|nr:oxidoreductase [Bacillota bacterium]